MNKLATLGRYFFALGVMATGCQQLITAEFVRLVPTLPPWLPWPTFWAYAVGAALVILGSAILLGRRAPLAAAGLAAMMFLYFLLQRVPEIASNPWAGFMWTNPSKIMALCGGAILIAGTPFRDDPTELAWARKLRPLGPVLMAVFLTICGIQHFVYADFVTTLVPPWMPALRFWTYFTGTALIAGGLGMLVPRTRTWAASLSGLMIFMWVWMLHIPRTVALRSAFEMAGVSEALALSGVALLVAGLDPQRATPGRGD